MRYPPSIDALGAGGFRVSGDWRTGSLLILNDIALLWPVTNLAQLTVADLAGVIAAGLGVSEFVLLGTGAVQGLPPRAVRDALNDATLGLEFMTTTDAARLHNVLASEGRRFATALIAL